MKRHDFFRLYIHYKITIIFGIISAVTLIGIYFYLNKSLTEHTYQRIRTNLLKQTFLARSILDGSLNHHLQPGEMDHIADRLGKDLDIRVTIVAIDGEVLGDFELDAKQIRSVENHLHRPEIQGALQGEFGESKRFSTTIRKDMLYIAAAFRNEN